MSGHSTTELHLTPGVNEGILLLILFFLMEYCSLHLFTLSKNAAIVGSINIIDIHLVHNRK